MTLLVVHGQEREILHTKQGNLVSGQSGWNIDQLC